MAHIVKKQIRKEICSHCNKISEVWIIDYNNSGMQSRVYLCGHCEKPIRIKNNILPSKSPARRYAALA